MAITAISTPTSYPHPAYNQIDFEFDSTNKNETGFRYVIDLFDAGTSNKIATFRVPPRPVDGYGEVKLSRLLQNKVEYDYNLTNYIDTASNSAYAYDLKVSEEYLYNWPFTDYFFPTAISGIVYTGLTSGSTHTYVVGDQVRVALTTTYNDFRDQLNGYFTVLAVTTTTIVLDIPWIGSGGVTPGTVTYADNRKTIFPNLYTTSNRSIFNGVLEHYDFLNKNFADYTSNTRDMLTSAPDNYYIRTNSNVYLNVWNGSSSDIRKIKFSNSNGEIFYSNPTVADYGLVVQGKVGPGNLPNLIPQGLSILPLIKDDTEWYEVEYMNMSDVVRTKKQRFYIDKQCSIMDIDLLFLDRMGSIMPFPFTLKSKKTIEVNKETYNQSVNVYKSYKISDFGTKTYHVDLNEKYELNSNYLTEEMSAYFEELLTSGFVLAKLNGQYYSVQIETKSSEIFTRLNKSLIRYTITISLALGNTINI
jgi:hypothetical protein